jgi:hypothetical protein
MLGSFATRPSPSHRGLEILREFLCEEIPAEPPGIAPLGVPPGETTQVALAIAVSGSPCSACHQVLDGPGIVFEHFDAIGRVRTMDNGNVVETSNIKVLLPGNDTELVNGPVNLADVIMKNTGAQDCFAQQWLTFALGRGVVDADQPSLRAIQADFHASGLQLQELIVSVLTSDTFLAPR